MASKVDTLVVDSGAFIKGAPLKEWSQNIVTIREILDEVRDVNTRRRLQVLPYDVTFREPSSQALRHVTSFAKKTGDYSSLSSVDLRLIALTYQLECELGSQRGTHLRAEPCPMQLFSTGSKPPHIVGFYSGSKRHNLANELTEVSHDHVENSHDPELKSHNLPESEITCMPVEDFKELSVEEERAELVEGDLDQTKDSSANSSDHLELNEDKPVDESIKCDDLERNSDSGDEDSDDDDDSWITPHNYEQACEKMGGALETGLNGITVGCVTTDYAMQNVLLQIGLNVVSVEGMRVRQLRTYTMKCKACFKVCSDTGRRFCPNCGNRTLMKVVVVLNGEDGTVQYKPLSEKQFSHKGLRHSIPLPKGGRHANNPILAPDQRQTSKERRTRGGRVDPLHPDYIAQTSPFAMKDVNSRGAQIRFAQGRGSGGRSGWRNNPNAAKPKGRKK